MEIRVHQGWENGLDAAVYGVFQEGGKDTKPIISKDLMEYKDLITQLAESSVFRGDKNTCYTLRNSVTGQVTSFLGLGKPDQVDVGDPYRQATGLLVHQLEREKVKKAHIHVGSLTHKDAKVSVDRLVQSMTEAMMLASYRFTKYWEETRAKKELQNKVKEVVFCASAKRVLDQASEGARTGEILAESQMITMDLANEPSNVLTPTELANQAVKLSKTYGLKCKILSEAEIRKEKMGCFLAVAQGSAQPPKFIVVEYKPTKTARGSKTICLVGKGITFDSGGISIKPAGGMELMKKDMTGAGVVLGAIVAAARLKLPHHIYALIPTCENMPSGTAINPGSVVTSRKGITVEIINTDAEGRLILADALDYAHEFKPDIIVDVATLTGAAFIALGSICSGILSNNDKLCIDLAEASETAAEKIWRLPLHDEYERLMKSETADLKNSGEREAGTIYGGKFLQKFVSPDVAWAHLDIAGTSWGVKHLNYITKTGSTGVGTRLLAEFLRQ